MKFNAFHISSMLAIATFAGAASAHNHMTVDTISGNPGDQVVIRAGYLPAESAYTIVDGRLMLNDEIAVYDVPDAMPQDGPLNGWYAGDELLLTSDFFYATGRLDGGNFMWELSSVTPVSGSPATVVWGDFDSSGRLTPSADSSAAERTGRSFNVAAGGHDHAQGYAISTPGVYDVTFIAWDSNGRYADSDPVTVRFNTIPEPSVGVMLTAGSLLAIRRRHP